MTKKSGKQKNEGVDKLIEKIEKEKEMEKLKQLTNIGNNINNNVINQKLQKLDSLKKKEKEYLSKIKEKKKKIQNEIYLFKKMTNISDEGLSQIKQDNQSEKESSFFSYKSPSNLSSYNLKEEVDKNKDFLPEALSINEFNIKNSNSPDKISKKEDKKNINENELYSFNSKESKKTSESKKENNGEWFRQSVKSFSKNKLEKIENTKNMRTSVKVMDFLIKKTSESKKINLKNNIEMNQDILSEKESEISESEKNEEIEENENEQDEFSLNAHFMKLPNEELKKIEKQNLVEYDCFYKEQFFKNDVFKYDAENIKDKEAEKIQKEIIKLDIKRKINENKKLKDVLELKGLDTKDIQEEINELNQKYKDTKKVEKQKIELNIDTTEEFLNKGKLLKIYFENKKEVNYPRFALESAEEIGAKEIIDFKPLRKEESSRRYFDYCFCLEERKKINRILVYSRYICKFFVDNWIFDNLSLLMIIINSILMFISDPTDPHNYANITDDYFLIFYALEAILKIITFTLYSAEDAYLKDNWNILDFSIVIVGIISFFLERFIEGGSKIPGLSALKSFRILRPLKTVKRFKVLKKLVIALLASIGHLGETATILFFFFLFFAVAGLQMWQGLFYRRCMNVNYGYFVSVHSDKYMCSFDSNCESLNSYGKYFVCAKGYANPNLGAINYDNIGTSLITVFVVVTLEGWSYIFTYVSKTFKDKIYINPIIIFIYFHTYIYFGSYYLINLFLAVTNSEFEHIERNRDKLTEKKNLFKLIQRKYDFKEKQKQEKKEKEKMLKNQNNKKSDEALKELYYKVKDRAFHISKNKRDIPKVYSTVKDIYIMANNNPEELYLEELRIENEEKSLSLDIKRQQREIKKMIRDKQIEMDKSKAKTLKKKIRRLRSIISVGPKDQNKIDEIKMADKYKASGIISNNNNNGNGNVVDDNKFNSPNKIANDLCQENFNLELSDILNLANKINSSLIQISIDNTIKYFKDKKINMAKILRKQKENKINKMDENQIENNNINEPTIFEDTDFEKELLEMKNKKDKTKKEKKRELTRIKLSTDKSFSFLTKQLKEKSNNKINYILRNRNSITEIGQNKGLLLNKEISFIEDLSLSNINESSENKSNITKEKTKKVLSNIHSKKNMHLTKLVTDKKKKIVDNFSYENNRCNINDFDQYQQKSINSIDNNTANINNNENSFSDNINILNSKIIELSKGFYLISKFEKPHSLLNSIEKYNDEQKFNDKNIRFNLKKYLKRKVGKDSEFINKDKRNSFLGFLEYAQFQKELKELDNLIKNDKDKQKIQINENSGNNEIDFMDNNLKFLSEDSFLSRNGDVSMEDIDILPQSITMKKIYENEYLNHENIKKNIGANKLTRKIRAEVFDRESINTNIHLTTNELKKYYEEANKQLDELLYSNKRKIRIRNDSNLNLSGIIKNKNYNKILKTIENNEEELNNKNKLELVEKMDINNEIGSPKKNLRKSGEKKEFDNIKVQEGINFKNKDMINQVNLNQSEKNSDFPLLTTQKSVKLLNAKISTKTIKREGDNNAFKFNIQNKSLSRNVYPNQIDKSIIFNSTFQNANQTNIYYQQKNTYEQKNYNYFIFKAKSIEKNINKYPTENSNKFLVKEENKEYTDPLTVKQELIPTNLRGKKYYMNYLYNIHDKDLKVKDNFKVNHWEDEILKKRNKIINIKPLPERVEASFVFNDKKLKLKKYKYINYNEDNDEDENNFKENDSSKLTIKLKYLPLNALSLTSKRLRNFGKFAMKKEINEGALTFRPDSAFLSTIANNPQQLNYHNSRSGRTIYNKMKSKGTLVMSSSYVDDCQIRNEIKAKKNIFEKIYKKIDEFNYLTLSHYFLKESNLYFKIIDKKRREEIINNIKEKNRKKYYRLNVRDEIDKILIFDTKTNSNRYIKWSGEDILVHSDVEMHKNKWDKLIKSLEDFNVIIWNQNNYINKTQKIRKILYELTKNDYFDYIVLIFVFLNPFFMALDGNFLKPEILNKLNICNYIFNGIFIFEYVVKFLGLTPLVYYSDAFTFLDTLIICFAILDMATPTNNDTEIVGSKKSVSSQLSFLRVFRIFRVVRLAKLLRRLKQMRVIIIAISNSLTSVYYIIIILIMFILIFELLGMSLFNGNKHYQSFLEGFYTTYQILTLENWDGIFIEIWPLNHLCIIYFLTWIFLGNYILFNLFISILIQSFGENEKKDKDNDDLSEEEIIEKIYILPDYLKVLKKNLKDDKIRNTLAKSKKIKNENIINIFQNSNTFSNSKDKNTKNSSSFSNLNTSKLSSIFNDDDDDEEDEKRFNLFSDTSEKNDEEEDNKNSSEEDQKLKEVKKKQMINKLFKNNDCEKSLFFFSQKNRFRIYCMKLINKKWFDIFILMIIVFSSIRLIIDTFLNGYFFVLIFDLSDCLFNLIFLLEASLKILALGFGLEEGSYLRDNWNKIDAIIVICSFVDFHNLLQKYIMGNNTTSSVEFLKVLRLLRTLRPLRFISHNFQLKLIITSLYDSIISIFNVLIILIVVLFMFSTVGISLFYSYYHDCYTLKSDGTFNIATNSFNNMLAIYEIRNDITSISNFCAEKFNGIMDTGPTFKFSNLETSLVTSYILSTMEGWPNIMSSYRIYDNYYGIYFVGFNFVVACFFLNLFTGIMFKYFNEAYKREQKIAKDDKKASKYYDFLTQIINAKSDYIIWNKPLKGTIKFHLREIVDSEIFENFIMATIFLNMMTMCISYDGCSEKLIFVLKMFNYLFNSIFIIECLLKLSAYGIRPYFYISWNKFDFVLVFVSIIEWMIADIDGIDATFLKTFQLIRVLKVLRVSRVIRLVKALKGLEKLIQTLQWSFNALINVLILIIILYCIFALIGCYLYDGVKYENCKDKFTYVNEYYNMDNFYNSYLLIFRCATGENWHNIMMEMAYREDGRGEGYSIAFFIICNFITGIILSNLLLMVTLQQYDEFSDKKYNPIDKFNSFLTDFNNAWNKFSTEEDEGFRIKKILVAQFFMELNWRKLNFPDKGKLEYIKKYINDLELYYDSDDNVYYHDIIFKLIYKQMGMQIDRNNPENNLIFKTEKKLQKKIKNIIIQYIHKRKGKNITLIPFNPLTTHLYYKLSFQYMKAFINYYKENSELIQNYEDVNSSRMEESEIFESHEYTESSNKNSEIFNDNKDKSKNYFQKALKKQENSNSINSIKENKNIEYNINQNKEKSIFEQIIENNNNENLIYNNCINQNNSENVELIKKIV